MTYPTSIRFICTIMEKFRLINYNQIQFQPPVATIAPSQSPLNDLLQPDPSLSTLPQPQRQSNPPQSQRHHLTISPQATLSYLPQTHPPLSNLPLRSFLCSFQHLLMVLFLALHFLSTLGRSRRYLPEFFQKFYEDCTFLLG